VENSKLFIVTPGPHIVATGNTSSMMRDVVIALLPSLFWGCYIYGLDALWLSFVCVAFCMFFEWVSRKVMKKEITIGDWSAVVTGMMLSMIIPVNIPKWMAVIGCFIAIVVVKQVFGGLGGNFANPTVTAGIILLLSFPEDMTSVSVNERMCSAIIATTARGGSTPLELFSNAESVPTNLQMLFGLVSGPIGTLSALTIIIGCVYLLARRVIDAVAPLSFILTVAIFAVIAGYNPLFHIMAGAVPLAAVFMASDPVTTPMTYTGKAVFGVGCGVLTMFMRLYATYPDSVLFAVLIMNILTPHIDRLTANRIYKVVKEGRNNG